MDRFSKYILVFTFMFGVIMEVNSQYDNLDSLYQNFDSIESDSMRSAVMLSIGWKLRNVNIDSSQKMTLLGLDIANKANDLHNQMRGNYYMAVLKRYTDTPEEGLVYCHNVIDITTKMKDTSRMALGYRVLGGTLRQTGDLTGAIDAFSKSYELNLIKPLSPIEPANVLLSIGILHQNQKNYDEAIEKFEEARSIYIEQGRKDKEAEAINNIGVTLKTKSQHAEAKKMFESAYAINDSLGNKSHKASNVLNIGLSNYNLKQPVEAELKLKEAESLYNEIGNKVFLGTIHLYLGNLAKQKGNNLKAKEYFLKADKELSTQSDFRDILETKKQLANVYNVLGENDEAGKLWNETLNLKDSLHRSAMDQEIQSALTRFETNKQEHEIEQLKMRQENQQRQKNFLLGGLLALFLGLGIMFYLNYLRSLSNKKLSEQNSKILELLKEKEQVLAKLKETQSALIQSEKMASLGQLTAGVAHEVNNPINFITSSVQALKMDMNELKTNEDPTTRDEILSEMQSMIDGIEEGAQRTANIVKGLRTFSTANLEPFQLNDVNEGIMTTINVLKHKLPEGVTIINDLGDIPPVKCQINRINQVILNVLDNSIYAVGQQGTIRIKTGLENDMLNISITDDGKGMNEEEKSKIFDPFYTTKDVGQGTGLGMYISYKIIQDHNGEIMVESAEGRGTEVKIVLNLNSQ